MPAGRPPKYTSAEKMQDGYVEVDHLNELVSNEFRKEADLRNYVVDNIEKFCKDVLSDEYASHKTEKDVNDQYRFGARPIRMDLYIKCKKHEYIIELKNPKHKAENKSSIWQLLSYGAMMKDTIERKLILISTKFDMPTAQAICEYRLPIEFIYFEKAKCLRFIGGSDGST